MRAITNTARVVKHGTVNLEIFVVKKIYHMKVSRSTECQNFSTEEANIFCQDSYMCHGNQEWCSCSSTSVQVKFALETLNSQIL